MPPYRDLWLWLGGLFLALASFLDAIAIANFVKEAHYALFLNPWMLSALLFFLAAFAAFFCAIIGWPSRQLVKPRFPDIQVEIYSTGSIDTEREASTGLDVPAHLRSVNVRLLNEDERSASLTIRLYVTLIPGSWGRAGEAVCPPPSWALSPLLNLHPIAMPVSLAPGGAVGGQLVYEVPRYYLDKIANPLVARLEIEDHTSGRKMNIPTEMGLYDKSKMVPSSGGVELLGPEYDAPPTEAKATGAPPGT